MAVEASYAEEKTMVREVNESQYQANEELVEDFGF